MSRLTNPIVILGMQRSGTSALSGALAELGAYFGSDEMLYEADANNPRGYFEHRKAIALNLRILDEFQLHVTTFRSLPEQWRQFPQAQELREQLKAFFVEAFAGRPLWVLKQPLTSLLLPIYQDVFAELGVEPSYLICVRNPLEAMRSEAGLDFGDSYRVMQTLGKMAVGSWLRYTLGSVCDSAPHRLHWVLYDDLLADPKTALESIVDRHPGWKPSNEQRHAAISSIRSDLRRHRVPIEALDELPPLVRRTYDAVVRAARRGDEGRAEFEPLYREFRTWVSMLAEPDPPPGRLGLSWTHEGRQRIYEQEFQVKPEWQTVSLQVDAPPNVVLSGLLYGLPAKVWIRRCSWRFGDRESEARLRCGPCSAMAPYAGVTRLDAAFEPAQIQVLTPPTPGPYRLEIELLLETGSLIHLAAAWRLAMRLDQCAAEVESLGRIKR